MSEPPTLNDFEPATYETWLERVQRDLGGACFEQRLVKRVAGLDIQPLYVRTSQGAESGDAAGLPGFAPFTRGGSALGASRTGWDVRPEIVHADPASAGRAIFDELNGGANSIALVLDRATRRGLRPSVRAAERAEGVAVADVAELDVVLEHVALDKIAVMLAPGASALPVAAGLFALAAKRHVNFQALSGALGADPLGTLAAEGGLPTTVALALAEAAELAAWTAGCAPLLRTLTVDTSAYHDASADAAIEIAVALSTGVAYLRALTGAGLCLDVAARQLVFSFSIGGDFFLEVAKLRAARCAWGRVVAACGGDSTSQAMVLHARTSRRTKTQRDPWVNLVRGAAESFSAAVGGADAITTASFDAALGESAAFGRRIARNTQHILRDESNVHRVVDPAGGSWYVESITDALARKAWDKFQAIERSGGMAAALETGVLQAELRSLRDAEREGVETRKIPIAGVNEFASVHEETVALRPAGLVAQRSSAVVALERFTRGSLVEQAIRAVSEGAKFLDVCAALHPGSGAAVVALSRGRTAAPFEALRDEADSILATTGQRPSVFLANLGDTSDHRTRAAFARNFFESGGFLVLGDRDYASAEKAASAFVASDAHVAAIVSSDPSVGQTGARALHAMGAHAVVFVGPPGSDEASYRAAGVTDFVFPGMNAVTCLRSLLERSGVRIRARG